MPEKTIIENSKNKAVTLQLKNLWKYRALIRVFVMRDIKVQYAQTKLGIVWSAFQATTAALIINFFFGILLKVDTGGFPYLVFAFPGMIAWYYFSWIISFAGTSLLQSQHIIKKVYFPKLILPFYKSFVGLFDVVIWFLIYLAIIIYYGHPLTLNILLLPFAVVLNMITGLSVAVWLAVITVRYRDALLFIPFLIGFGIFITPVFFPGTLIPEQYHFILHFNPMAGVIAVYRWCLIAAPFSMWYLAGIVPVVILFVTGLYYFRRIESVMADVI